MALTFQSVFFESVFSKSVFFKSVFSKSVFSKWSFLTACKLVKAPLLSTLALHALQAVRVCKDDDMALTFIQCFAFVKAFDVLNTFWIRI